MNAINKAAPRSLKFTWQVDNYLLNAKRLPLYIFDFSIFVQSEWNYFGDN